MPMNIQDYLSNPMGKGSSIYMMKEVRSSLDQQYTQFESKITLVWYNLKDRYYIAHIRIPSKSVSSLFYDVLILFDIATLADGSTVINSANAKVFSNCPSFTYTYANVFNKNGNLISWTKLKYPSEIFSKGPVQRNPNRLVGYEKSLYIAIKYILSNRRNYLSNIQRSSVKISSYQSVYTHIANATEIVEYYKIRKKKDQQKELPKKKNTLPEKKTSDTNKKNSSKTVSKTKKTKVVKTTNKIKKTKKI